MSRRLLCLYLPDLPSEAAEQNRIKQRLTRWCNRYSPLVADDNSGGIVLDITGCAHLFDGEENLLNDIESRIRDAGLRVRGAIADTLGAAWALARYSKQAIVSGSEIPQALNPLPVEGLRLPEEITRALRRVGLSSIGAFHKIGRRALVTRFGPSTLLRLDQAFGQLEETITPLRQPAPYSVRRALPEPVAHTGAVEHVVSELVTELCVRLQKDHTGARRVQLDCYRVDGLVSACGISTSKPVRSVKHLMRLFSEKIETVDAGFGIETLILSVLNFDRFDPAQLTLTHFDPDRNGDNEAFDELIDRIGLRLGFEHVSRLRVQQSFLPEFTLQFESVTAPITPNALWPEYRLRPVYWVDPPMRIEVATIHPAGSPVQFRMGRDTHRIVKAEGPERLTPEWWRLETRAWQMRDYYRIEDDRGCRFWIFQEFHAAAAPARRWFLRGHLP